MTQRTAPRPVALCIHGHFYQPPRENPWTDAIEREPGAAPYHDWNARIHAECYRANAFARIHDAEGRIERIVNTYERISFNFGSTLARWIERTDPRAYLRLLAGDARGGAMAQPWAHPIVPLLTPADRRTQILWGLADFRGRFGRDAGGLWLPETAADATTLETLIELGIRFTILAPEQVAAVRPPEGAWRAVDRDTVDTGRLYRYVHRDGSGRFLVVGVFDGTLSRAVAFGDATRDAATFLRNVNESAQRSNVPGRRVVICASDGELYGHHKKFADLTLTWVTNVETRRRDIEVMNLAEIVDSEPATWELRLADGPGGEGTSWSCPHGLGRWQRHCGCVLDPRNGSQAWRGPLRQALDLLREQAAGFFEDAAGRWLYDPWGARDAYGAVVDAPPPDRDACLAAFGREALSAGGEEARRELRLLFEMQRAALLMYASCGWFFDDIAGVESRLVLRQAAYVLDLMAAAGAAPPTAAVLEVLAACRSNDPRAGSGADVFRSAAADRVKPATAVAQVAFAALADPRAADAPPPLAGYDVDIGGGMRRDPAATARISGEARVVHRRTGSVRKLAFAAARRGKVDFRCRVWGAGVATEVVRLEDLPCEARYELLLAALPGLVGDAREPHARRAALAVIADGAASGALRTPEASLMLGQVLVALLGETADEPLPDSALVLCDEILEVAKLPPTSAERRIVEELVFERLGVNASPALLMLAERLGFAARPTEAKADTR